jgi:hypothetical protein
MVHFLEEERPSSVGVRSCTFYGGTDKYLTGFELKADNFKRIFRITQGSKWLTHRPPTIQYPVGAKVNLKHINSDELYNKTGVQMYHYSYVFPHQVRNKIQYYKEAISLDNAIDNYYESVYLPWVLGNDNEKQEVENKFNGVHEFKPSIRGECRTEFFKGSHPESIECKLQSINNKIKEQLDEIPER